MRVSLSRFVDSVTEIPVLVRKNEQFSTKTYIDSTSEQVRSRVSSHGTASIKQMVGGCELV